MRIEEQPVAEIWFRGRTYYRTGKLGHHTHTGEQRAEFACKDDETGREYRAWANFDGSDIEED